MIWDDMDNVIRLKGRMPKSDIIILPKHSRVSDLYLRYLHLQQLHLSGQALMARAQRRVHVLGGRETFKKSYRCCSCRSGKQLKQQMARLPIERQEISMQSWVFISCGKTFDQLKGAGFKLLVAYFEYDLAFFLFYSYIICLYILIEM